MSCILTGISQFSGSQELSQYEIYNFHNSAITNSIPLTKASKNIESSEEHSDIPKTGRSSVQSSDSQEYLSISTSTDTLRSRGLSDPHTISAASSKADISNGNLSSKSLGHSQASLSSGEQLDNLLSSASSLCGNDYSLNESLPDLQDNSFNGKPLEEIYLEKLCRLGKKQSSATHDSGDDKKSSLDSSFENSIAECKCNVEENCSCNHRSKKNNSDLRLNFLHNIFWQSGSSEVSNNTFSNKFKEKFLAKSCESKSKDEIDGKKEFLSESPCHQRSHSNIENGSGLVDLNCSDVSRGYDSDETLLRSPKKVPIF